MSGSGIFHRWSEFSLFAVAGDRYQEIQKENRSVSPFYKVTVMGSFLAFHRNQRGGLFFLCPYSRRNTDGSRRGYLQLSEGTSYQEKNQVCAANFPEGTSTRRSDVSSEQLSFAIREVVCDHPYPVQILRCKTKNKSPRKISSFPCQGCGMVCGYKEVTAYGKKENQRRGQHPQAEGRSLGRPVHRRL